MVLGGTFSRMAASIPAMLTIPVLATTTPIMTRLATIVRPSSWVARFETGTPTRRTSSRATVLTRSLSMKSRAPGRMSAPYFFMASSDMATMMSGWVTRG